jgi:SAM-dependent methyltransferase
MKHQAGKEIDWKKDSQSFDGVADFYDAYRPEYPAELVECVISTTGIPPNGKILEVGSGTGKATASFACKGYSILCVEPGKNLVSIAAQRLRDFPNVEFEATTFEEWDERPGEFDLVMSAQAFHWVPKEVGFAKAARALKANGYLALFWNMYPDPEGEIFRELDKVYQECVPEMMSRIVSYEETIWQREKDIVESSCFGSIEVRRFPWSARYDTKQYLGLLNTYSDHLRLPEEKRASLFEGVAEVINQHGGYIEKPYLAVLYLARKV